MQIFVQLPSGKTVSIDCCLEMTVGMVRKAVNELHLQGGTPVSLLLYKKAFYEEEHPMKVAHGEVLDLERLLTDLYVNGIIKEITLQAVH
jgi:hypothetical protein